jgi:acetyl-CoA carboxylase alpha subunit
MLTNSIFAVIAPEGTATILYRDASRASDIAGALRITAPELQEPGLIDAIVPEPPAGAHTNPALAASYLKAAVLAALRALHRLSHHELIRERQRKYRQIGPYAPADTGDSSVKTL